MDETLEYDLINAELAIKQALRTALMLRGQDYGPCEKKYHELGVIGERLTEIASEFDQLLKEEKNG